jgi:DNA polymerase
VGFKSNVRKGSAFLIESTYSGKMVENITQAVARDLMANGMMNAERNGYVMVTTIHDELVTEVSEGRGDVEEFERLICQLPTWAEGLPIKAAGYRSKRYKKG